MYGELSGTQIENLLYVSTVGHLGCYGDERPYVVPIITSMMARMSMATRATDEIAPDARASDRLPQVDQIEGIANWQSVVAWGTFEELHGDDAEKAQQMMTDRFTPLLGGTPIQGAHGMGGWGSHPPTWPDAVLYRITLTTKTGRYKTP